MSNSKVNTLHTVPPKPIFTEAHIDWLNYMYPEQTVYNPNTTEVYRSIGERSVVKHIERLVSESKIKRG